MGVLGLVLNASSAGSVALKVFENVFHFPDILAR